MEYYLQNSFLECHMTGAEISRMPDLTDRTARCHCGRTKPSSTVLERFEYQGPGSRSASDVCVCGYHKLAHHNDIQSGAVSPTLRNCPGFRPRGDLGYDVFWCGCDGDGSGD
jgi:hypothetical protein